MKLMNYSKEYFNQVEQLEKANLDNRKEACGFLFKSHDKNYFTEDDLIVIEKGELIGVVGLKQKELDTSYEVYDVDLQEDNHVLVSVFVIDKEYRKKGIATKVFNYLIDLYQDKQILLEADTKNTAGNSFYRFMGMASSEKTVLFEKRNWRLYYKNPVKQKS